MYVRDRMALAELKWIEPKAPTAVLDPELMKTVCTAPYFKTAVSQWDPRKLRSCMMIVFPMKRKDGPVQASDRTLREHHPLETLLPCPKKCSGVATPEGPDLGWYLGVF